MSKGPRKELGRRETTPSVKGAAGIAWGQQLSWFPPGFALLPRLEALMRRLPSLSSIPARGSFSRQPPFPLTDFCKHIPLQLGTLQLVASLSPVLVHKAFLGHGRAPELPRLRRLLCCSSRPERLPQRAVDCKAGSAPHRPFAEKVRWLVSNAIWAF